MHNDSRSGASALPAGIATPAAPVQSIRARRAFNDLRTRVGLTPTRAAEIVEALEGLDTNLQRFVLVIRELGRHGISETDARQWLRAQGFYEEPAATSTSPHRAIPSPR